MQRVKGSLIHDPVKAQVRESTFLQQSRHLIFHQRIQPHGRNVLHPGLITLAAQADDIKGDQPVRIKVIKAQEKPFPAALAPRLRSDPAFFFGHDRVKIAVLKDQQPARPQAVAKIHQRPADIFLSGQVREGVAQADERVKWICFFLRKSLR